MPELIGAIAERLGEAAVVVLRTLLAALRVLVAVADFFTDMGIAIFGSFWPGRRPSNAPRDRPRSKPPPAGP